MTKLTLAEQTAQRLHNDLSDYSSTRLPTIRQLAGRYGVSHVTMVRACGILKEQGVLEGRRGMPLQRKHSDLHRQPDALEPPHSSLEEICARIEDDIATGRFRAGDKLPKVLFYVKEYSVSNHTVLKAYRELERRGLIRREGKSWIIGSAGRPRPIFYNEEPPVILLIEPRRLFWQRQIRHSRTLRFATSFMQEAERWGVQALSLSVAMGFDEREGHTIDWQTVARLIRDLGNRYLGALAPFGAKDKANPADYIREALRFGKPVVWLDRHDDGRIEGFNPRLFTRCHFSEQNVIELAIHHLYETGHRTVGYVCHDTGSYWRIKRLQDLCEEAGRRPHFKVIGFTQPTGFYDGLFNDRFPRLLSRLRSCSPPNVDKALRRLASLAPMVDEWSKIPKKEPREPREPGSIDEWERCIDELTLLAPVPKNTPRFIHDAVAVLRAIRYTPVYQRYAHLGYSLNLSPALMKALNHPDITALITPNDQDARNIFEWLRNAGIQIPREISLLSFDNSDSLAGFPVTTIDFGFGVLGYNAFHLFLGDVPVKRNRRGEIASQPHIVHRRSIKYLG